ncbi:MAG TPA: VIT domain-containing protein, partial [Fibrobacteria bacterium]|nr:VIT domain-containing protein [Fibrobacteria bacterium]
MTARAWLRIAIVMVWGSVAAFGQIPVELLRGSVLGISSSVSGPQKILPPLNTRVNIVVTDAVAQAVVTQIFLPPEGGASEAVFYFPLPEQGSVNGMRYVVGSAAYVAKIMEKEKAEARYDSLVKNGGQGAMTLQRKPNVFEHRLATLKP